MKALIGSSVVWCCVVLCGVVGYVVGYFMVLCGVVWCCVILSGVSSSHRKQK